MLTDVQSVLDVMEFAVATHDTSPSLRHQAAASSLAYLALADGKGHTPALVNIGSWRKFMVATWPLLVMSSSRPFPKIPEKDTLGILSLKALAARKANYKLSSFVRLVNVFFGLRSLINNEDHTEGAVATTFDKHLALLSRNMEQFYQFLEAVKAPEHVKERFRLMTVALEQGEDPDERVERRLARSGLAEAKLGRALKHKDQMSINEVINAVEELLNVIGYLDYRLQRGGIGVKQQRHFRTMMRVRLVLLLELCSGARKIELLDPTVSFHRTPALRGSIFVGSDGTGSKQAPHVPIGQARSVMPMLCPKPALAEGAADPSYDVYSNASDWYDSFFVDQHGLAKGRGPGKSSVSTITAGPAVEESPSSVIRKPVVFIGVGTFLRLRDLLLSSASIAAKKGAEVVKAIAADTTNLERREKIGGQMQNGLLGGLAHNLFPSASRNRKEGAAEDDDETGHDPALSKGALSSHFCRKLYASIASSCITYATGVVANGASGSTANPELDLVVRAVLGHSLSEEGQVRTTSTTKTYQTVSVGSSSGQSLDRPLPRMDLEHYRDRLQATTFAYIGKLHHLDGEAIDIMEEIQPVKAHPAEGDGDPLVRARLPDTNGWVRFRGRAFLKLPKRAPTAHKFANLTERIYAVLTKTHKAPSQTDMVRFGITSASLRAKRPDGESFFLSALGAAHAHIASRSPPVRGWSYDGKKYTTHAQEEAGEVTEEEPEAEDGGDYGMEGEEEDSKHAGPADDVVVTAKNSKKTRSRRRVILKRSRNERVDESPPPPPPPPVYGHKTGDLDSDGEVIPGPPKTPYPSSKSARRRARKRARVN
jgi:hypothetical protein